MFKITISIIILPVTFILVCLIGCKDILFTMEPEYPEFVEFVNNSNKTIFIILDEEGYPDSIAPNIGTTCSVKPRAQNTLFCDCWSREEYMAKYPTIQLFIGDCDAYDKDPMIKLQDLILKRYVLTREWLEQYDWTVTYP